MTLKNNHLIVETEERNDIEEDSRETTMKYSPSARDGVFVVEVQQGVRRSPGSGGPPSAADPELSISVSDQCALVHNPPDRYSDDETLEECDDNDYYIETTSPARETPDSSLATQIKTGLAQSDTSLSGDRHTYCYTNQQCYDSGSYGYQIYNGYINDEPPQRLKDNNKPKITAAVYKNRSRTTEEIDEDEVQEEQNRLGNSVGKQQIHILDATKQNDISLTGTAETDVRSGEYENKGFDNRIG